MGKRTNTAVWLEKYGRWQIKVQKDGVRRTFTSSRPGRTGQREANRKADAWLDDGVEDPCQKVADVYPHFLARKQDTTSRSNYESMEARWRNHIAPVIGRKTVAALTERDLQDVIDKAFARRHLAQKTLGNIRGDLMAFMKYCRQARLTTLFPESLTIPTAAAKPDKTILQPRDFVVLFNSETTLYRGRPVRDNLIHAYRLAVLTGLRPGELRGLQWGDVRPDRIELHRSINKYQEITRGKNDNARRVVELSALARQEMTAQRQESGAPEASAPVFNIPTEEYYREHLARFCAYNGIARCTPYELRHTFVSIAKVLPAGLVKSLVGHSEDMDTFGVYGHELDSDAAMRADALDGMFDRLLKGQETG